MWLRGNGKTSLMKETFEYRQSIFLPVPKFAAMIFVSLEVSVKVSLNSNWQIFGNASVRYVLHLRHLFVPR